MFEEAANIRFSLSRFMIESYDLRLIQKVTYYSQSKKLIKKKLVNSAIHVLLSADHRNGDPIKKVWSYEKFSDQFIKLDSTL